MRNIFISIVNFNGKENTIDCLKSLEKIPKDKFDLKIIVIDNASKEELKLPYFQKLDIHLIKNKENLGFSGGHNLGIKFALSHGADYILVLNNDTVIDKNLILELVKSFDNDVGISCPKIYFAPGLEFHKDRYKKEELGKVIWYAGGEMDWKNVIGRNRGVDEVDRGQYEKTCETDFASGACFLIKKNVIEKIGMFDEKYFLYYEDSDLSERTRRAGYKIVYLPNAFLWHKNAASVGGPGSNLQDYYITRNRLIFGMKFAPLTSKLSLLRESFRLLTSGRQWQKRGVLDFYLKRFGKGSYK